MSFSTRLEEGQLAKKPNMTAFGFVALGERQLYTRGRLQESLKGLAEVRFHGKVLGTVLGTVHATFQLLENAKSQNSTYLPKLTHVGRHTTNLSRHTREPTGAAACVLARNFSGLHHVVLTSKATHHASARPHRRFRTKTFRGSPDSHLIGRPFRRHDELAVVLDTVVLECTTQPGSSYWLPLWFVYGT